MGGAVYGLIAIVAVVMLSKRIGYEWREASRLLRIATGFFALAVIFEGAAIVSNEEEPAIFGSVSAAIAWFLLVLAVFDIADPDEAPTADDA